MADPERRSLITQSDLADDEYEEVEYEEIEGGSSRGCLWGLVGMMGCLFIIVAILGGVVFMGINTVGGVVDGIKGIVDPPPKTYSVLDEVTILDRVQDLSQLTTMRFNYSQLITTERDMPGLLRPLYGEKLVMNAVGHINAGIDLSQLTTENIQIVDGVMTVTLPPPQLLDCILNTSETRIVDSSTGVFTADSDIEEQTRIIAIRGIRDFALADDILTEANAHAQTTVADLLGLITTASTAPDETPLIVNVVTSPPPEVIAEFPDTCR